MNYRELFKKYMNHVIAEEGVSFVSKMSTRMLAEVKFTEEEIKICEDIEHELDLEHGCI